MTLLKVSRLSKSFGGLKAVDGLSFQVQEGEVLGLIGPNGSGKSTALSLIMGIIAPDEGSSVKLDGIELCGLPTHKVAKYGIAIVFQHSRPLVRQTILENIQLALYPNSLRQLTTPDVLIQKARKVGARVGLAGVLDRRPDELPYASLRRLELARAIAASPRVCLLDEPFAGLAPAETEEFSEVIRALRTEGWTLVLVDHNVQAVTKLVDRLVVLNAGRKIAEGSSTMVTKDPMVREVYFGVADDDTIIDSIPSQGPPSRRQHVDQPLLEVDIQLVRYDNAVAVRNASVSINTGEFVSIVGLNGAGKTTLLNCIFGFKEYEGSIMYSGRNLRTMTPAQIARAGIALCPETRELFGSMTVRENLVIGGHDLASGELRRQLKQVVDLFPRLGERLRQRANTLSGGEQQMLTIGRALMRQPELLLLDEPTLGLAPLVNQDISAVIYRLQTELNMSILLVEQNITFAIKHSHRIYYIENGEIQWSGGPDEFESDIASSIL